VISFHVSATTFRPRQSTAGIGPTARGINLTNNEVTLVTNIHPFSARFAIMLTILTAGSARAGQVTGFNWHSGVASLAATSIVPPSAPNNDNVVGLSPNEIFITQKNYFAVGPVDLTFDVSNTGGTTEYAFKEGVFNGTGLPWIGYHLELGYGFDATYVKSLPGDGLDFDAPDFDSGLQFAPGPGFYFPTALATEDDIVASGGVMPNGGFAGYFRFTVDVPDGITTFTVRQSPIAAPEPCSCIFALIGLVGFALCRRRGGR
jgi:hypothetical protein